MNIKQQIVVMVVIAFVVGAGVLVHHNTTKKVEPVKVEPVKVEPVKVEPVKVEPVKVEPVKVEPVKVEPVKVEPVKVEPVKVPDASLKQRAKKELDWYHSAIAKCHELLQIEQNKIARTQREFIQYYSNPRMRFEQHQEVSGLENSAMNFLADKVTDGEATESELAVYNMKPTERYKDVNEDGVLIRDEVQDGYKELFDRLDKDINKGGVGQGTVFTWQFDNADPPQKEVSDTEKCAALVGVPVEKTMWKRYLIAHSALDVLTRKVPRVTFKYVIAGVSDAHLIEINLLEPEDQQQRILDNKLANIFDARCLELQKLIGE